MPTTTTSETTTLYTSRSEAERLAATLREREHIEDAYPAKRPGGWTVVRVSIIPTMAEVLTDAD